MTLPLALDAMGGDNSPEVVLRGAALALEKYPHLRFILVGDEQRIRDVVAEKTATDKNECSVSLAQVMEASDIIHTDAYVRSDERPSLAVRQGKNTSMRMAIELVKDHKASAVVSAGNTGAFMAMSKLVLKTLPNISRPAILGILPTSKHDIVMLDMGANVTCDAREHFQFALMGSAYAEAVMQIKTPKVALLNIGSEEVKGHGVLGETASMLRDHADINFTGYIEGNHIMHAAADVVVTDGFTGNVALKTIEGTSSFFYAQLRAAIQSSLLGKIGYLLVKPAFGSLRKRVDPRRFNGAFFVGLNGIAVKSHGGADAYGFSHAIRRAHMLVEGRINDRIKDRVLASMPINQQDSTMADVVEDEASKVAVYEQQ